MPELPDITVYVEALTERLVSHRLEHILLRSPFVLRSVDPPLAEIEGRVVQAVLRMAKRIVVQFPGDLFLVFHLMIAGRLRWREPAAKAAVGGKLLLAELVFDNGRVLFTEAGTKKRASLTLVRGEAALRALYRGGLEPLEATLKEFRLVLGSENHTLKRSLTDQRLLSGIGNAYSDEILHRARLSPLKQTRTLTDDETSRLHAAMQATLIDWTERLRARAGGSLPEKVTAFHPDMAVHGRYGLPCPDCGSPIQRIVYVDNECNYCARCQTGGRLLADRSMSRLLKEDWPRSLDEL